MSPSSWSRGSGWSEDRVAILAKLWRDGLSASQIAMRLGGLTRNAVIGKIHRLGLSGRGAPSAPRAIAPRAARPRRLQRVVAPASAEAHSSVRAPFPLAPEGPGLVTDLVDLGAHACKWPIGDPKSPEFSFCGRSTDACYCAAHQAQAVRPGTRWRADHDPVVKRALAGLLRASARPRASGRPALRVGRVRGLE